MGSLSLLQGIFLTQESNRGLLHCRQIFYQLSYEGSPSEVDEPRACYTEQSKSEREKQISYIDKYMHTNEPICRAGIETQT